MTNSNSSLPVSPSRPLPLWTRAKAWLANPFLSKELRTTSRRGRFFILRGVYLAALAVATALTWLSSTGGGTAEGVAVGRMADAGKAIVAGITWFQFVASQIVIVLLMSTAIGGEINRRTFPILLTTPITPMQIVLGKLLGGMSHILILLLVSLPLMGVIRVFGGVPWEQVVVSLCVTACACFLAGALTLHVSMFTRQPYVVAMLGLAYVLFYNFIGWALVPALYIVLAILLIRGPKRDRPHTQMSFWSRVFGAIGLILSLYFLMVVWKAVGLPTMMVVLSPGGAIVRCTGDLLTPLSTCPPAVYALGCLVTISTAAVVLARVANTMRDTLCRNAWGKSPAAGPRFADVLESSAAMRALSDRGAEGRILSAELGALAAAEQDLEKDPRSNHGRMHRRARAAGHEGKEESCEMWGSPVLWREPKKLVPASRAGQFALAMPVWMAIVFWVFFILDGSYRSINAHAWLVAIIAGLALLLTAYNAACSISLEREARTWGTLMTTPLSNWQIFWPKMVGVLLRVKLLWLLLAGHLLVFTLLFQIHPIAVFFIAVVVLWSHVFICALAFYISTRVKGVNAAVTTTLGVLIMLWVLAPMAGEMMTGIWWRGSGSPAAESVSAVLADARKINPLGQMRVLVGGSPGSGSKQSGEGLRYWWRGSGERVPQDLPRTAVLTLETAGGYLLAGGLLAVLACRRFRKAS